MKRIILPVLLLSAAMYAAAADPGVTNVIARQRWPWSAVVDIDFVVTGTNAAVKFTAQYDGVEPFELAEKDLAGDFATALEPGLHHVSWNPARAGLGATELKNFRVAASIDTTDRTYLVLNLVDGSYRYMAAPPDEGWLSEPANYRTNMVFRRIPAGTSVLGLPAALKTKVGLTQGNAGSHTATLSSDYYIGVFPVTTTQHNYITNRLAGNAVNVSSGKRTVVASSYNNLRGSVSGDGIDWPNTRYEVCETKAVAAYRKAVEDTFPVEWIVDLPSVAQWERAARATTPTNWLWSVGGTEENTSLELTNLVKQIAICDFSSGSSDKNVGQCAPNGWGLYDMVGLCYEWNLDYCDGSGTSAYSGTDPVGPSSQENGYRARRSAAHNTVFKYLNTAANVTAPPSNGNTGFGYRLCIHLRSLFE